MSCKAIHILTVGKMKNLHYKAVVAEYAKRLNFYKTLTQTEVADTKYASSTQEGQADEAQRILAALSDKDIVISLDERGKTLSSVEFSKFVINLSENATKRPCFIIGGAYGLHDKVKERSTHLLAFGAMTLPHELARVLLYEQLYRSECIARNTPYHH